MAAEIHASPDPLSGTPKRGDVVDDKYRIERVLGVGGMGVVLEAWHLQLHEKVAIKVLQPALGRDVEALGRFEREARAIVRIKSEHVTRVLDVGRLPSKTPYIVMEYLDGRDLAQLLQKGYPFPVEEAIAHVLQACEVVAEAHTLGIVHRDLKPENLFLTRRRDGSACVKVLDFGLSKVRPGPGDASRPARALTAYRQAMGTPNYMSPEQWMSARDVGPASDQWALAVILYELLAGKPAFGGKDIGQVCTKVLHQSPSSLTAFRQDVSPRLERVIFRALEKDHEQRFPSIYEFAAALAPFGSELSLVSVERVAGIFSLSTGERSEPALPGGPPDAGPESTAPTLPRVRGEPLDHQDPGSQAATATDYRPQTAQSWQQMFRGESPSRARSAALVLLGGAVVLLGVLVVVAVMISGTESVPDSAVPGEGDDSGHVATASSALSAAPSTATADAAVESSAAPDTAPSVEPSAGSTAEPSVRARPRTPRPSRPRPKATAPKPNIFDSRQ